MVCNGNPKICALEGIICRKRPLEGGFSWGCRCSSRHNPRSRKSDDPSKGRRRAESRRLSPQVRRKSHSCCTEEVQRDERGVVHGCVSPCAAVYGDAGIDGRGLNGLRQLNVDVALNAFGRPELPHVAFQPLHLTDCEPVAICRRVRAGYDDRIGYNLGNVECHLVICVDDVWMPASWPHPTEGMISGGWGTAYAATMGITVSFVRHDCMLSAYHDAELCAAPEPRG